MYCQWLRDALFEPVKTPPSLEKITTICQSKSWVVMQHWELFSYRKRQKEKIAGFYCELASNEETDKLVFDGRWGKMLFLLYMLKQAIHILLLVYEFQQSILFKIRQQNEFNNQPSHIGMKSTDHLMIEVFKSVEMACIACSFGPLLTISLALITFTVNLKWKPGWWPPMYGIWMGKGKCLMAMS